MVIGYATLTATWTGNHMEIVLVDYASNQMSLSPQTLSQYQIYTQRQLSRAKNKTLWVE